LLASASCFAFRSSSASKAVVVEGNSKEIVFSGLEDILSEDNVQIRIFGKPEIKGHRRLGVILASDDSVEAALEKAERAYTKLKVEVL
jgi:phosphoribosylglycinamide formyltransferase 2